MAKKHALIVIWHIKPEWQELSEEEQAGFAARVRRAADKAGVTPVVGYNLSTAGAFMEIWEADTKESLDDFRQKLDALGYKKYYDEVLMRGERDAAWIESATDNSSKNK